MKDIHYEKLLNAIHRVETRVSVIEARTEDLPDIKKALDGLKVKVAGYSATVAIVVALATVLVSKLAQ